MATVTAIMGALAAQIQAQLSGTADPLIETLQVTPLLNFNPTPPSVDIYPADPFQAGLAFGKGNREMFFTVRVRVSTSEHEGGQELLLSMMDPTATTSMAKAIVYNKTLGNTVDQVQVDGPTGFGVFADAGSAGSLLGCTWTARVLP